MRAPLRGIAHSVDVPAFIVVDDKGNDFFEDVSRPLATTIQRRPGLEDR